MGAPDRIWFDVIPAFGLLLSIDRHPYDVTISICIGCFVVNVGLGKSYVQRELENR